MPLYKLVKLAVMPPGCLILALLIMALLLWINTKKIKNGSISNRTATKNDNITVSNTKPTTETLSSDTQSNSNTSNSQPSTQSLSWGTKILYYINKFVATLAVILAGFTFLLSADAVSQRLLNNLEYSYPSGSQLIISTEDPAAIFVLGGDTAVRCQGALQLYKQTGLDLVVSGYQGEAARMRDYLLAHGVPDYKIIQEPKATNTKDHLKYMLPIAMEKGYHKIYLVTSAFHMPRSMMIMEQGFAAQGIKLIPYGCGHQTTPDYDPMPHEWAPNMLSLYQGTTALNEYLGMVLLKLLG